METTIAAREVLIKIKEHFGKNLFTIDQLGEQLNKSFEGKLDTILFQNCHGSDFTFDQLINFFVLKVKLVKVDEKFSLAKEFSCSCE